jgi:multidrug efflux pump subunit AcrA (membrane-fusion protein)
MLASLHLRAAARAAHWAVAFAGLGLALLVGCSDRDRAPASKEPRPVCVKVAIVRETQVSVPLVAPGQVSAFSSVAIRSQASGELERVHFNEGDRIQAGDLLFTIDPKPFETSLAEAKAGLERDLALQKTAESEQQADRLLFKSKIISQQNYNESASDGPVQLLYPISHQRPGRSVAG